MWFFSDLTCTITKQLLSLQAVIDIWLTHAVPTGCVAVLNYEVKKWAANFKITEAKCFITCTTWRDVSYAYWGNKGRKKFRLIVALCKLNELCVWERYRLVWNNYLMIFYFDTCGAYIWRHVCFSHNLNEQIS